MRFIFEFRWLIRMAAHTPITALGFTRGLLVLVANSKSFLKRGAYVDSSHSRVSHLKCFRSSGFWLCRMDLARSEAMALISLDSSLPIMLTMWPFVVESFRDSAAMVFLLLRATAFPKCFRRGVRTNVLGCVYPTLICIGRKE